ncbi:MAG: ATP-grasp domain-containing protein [Candidatus Omnitrophota bacterium]
MKVALTYNLKKLHKDPELPLDFYSEFDSEKTVNSIKDALLKGGNEVILVEADGNLVDNLIRQKENIDIVFNIAEGQSGPSRESRVPAILDYFGIPYTGSGVLALAVALDKALTKKVFMGEGIPTPRFQLFKTPIDTFNRSLKFPLIVKPNCEGSAKGITRLSVVQDESQLREQVDLTLELYNQDALVEEFIEGKEITVGVLGNGELLVMPILEIDFSNCEESGEYFYSWRMKEYQGDAAAHLVPAFYCPARLDEKTTQRVKNTAKRAHLALGCNDFSRTDIRLSSDGTPYILEVNPLPGLDPEESNFTYIAKSHGIDYVTLINRILQNAIDRKGVVSWRKKDGGILSCGKTSQRNNGKTGDGS